MSTAAVVAAAGRGERLGMDRPKALHEVAGVPLLVHAVRALRASGVVDLVAVASPPGHVEETAALLRAGADEPCLVVEGASDRQGSVSRALDALPPDVDVVLVHDAARAFTPPEVVARVETAVRAGAAAVIPVVAVTDTIKEVRADVVSGTIDRRALRAVQTPQGFRRDVLVRAHREGPTGVTDDAGLVEALGLPVHVVAGSAEAFKVTSPLDLLIAEAVLRSR